MLKRRIPATLILCSGLIFIPVSAQTGNSSSTSTNKSQSQAAESGEKSTVSAADRAFIQNAAEGGKAEVELGQLAAKKGSSEEVKQFGQRMVDDHSKANQELQQLASEKGVRLPHQLTAKDLGTKTRLQELSGKQFDRAYMHNMVVDHTQDVTEFQQRASTAKDPDVKSFAQNTLPTLQDHLKMAKEIASKQPVASSKPHQ